MKILCIDMGNTRTHCAVVENENVDQFRELPTKNFGAKFSEYFANLSAVDGIAWCSVVPKEAGILQSALETCGKKALRLCYKNCPIKIDLKNPAEVGDDRLADAIGAARFFKPPYICVDMGTAITIDLVDKSGSYAGGAIAPGLHAFTLYLHEKTALLPKIDPQNADYSVSVGKSTVEAMSVGCVKGLCRLIDGIINDIQAEFFDGQNAEQKTVFTGGSLSLLPKKWLALRRRECHLALLGLHDFYITKIQG